MGDRKTRLEMMEEDEKRAVKWTQWPTTSEQFMERIRQVDYKSFLLGSWEAHQTPSPRQRVINVGDRVTVDGRCVPAHAYGKAVLAAAAEDDIKNGLTPVGWPRHVLEAKDGTRAYCGGFNVCKACGVTLEHVLAWKDRIGRLSFEWFGRYGAHCSQATYDVLKEQCTRVVHSNSVMNIYCDPLLRNLNSFFVHVTERSIPDGVLQPCDCKEEKENGKEAQV